MNLIHARLTALGAAVVFVGSAQLLQAIGLDYAMEDCLAAAVLATAFTIVFPPS